MPSPASGQTRIRTNIASQNAYNALTLANKEISTGQLRLSTGKRINNAADDVAGYITSRSLIQRNTSLEASTNLVGQAQNVSNILMDSLDEISSLLTTIKQNTAAASSGAVGTDEIVAQAKAAYRLTEQIQTVVDSTVFGGRQLLDGQYNADFYIGLNAKNELLVLDINMQDTNTDFDIDGDHFNVNALSEENFAGIEGLNLKELYNVEPDNLGIFSDANIATTLVSIADAITNCTKVAAYLGGISTRLDSQSQVLLNQMTNYDAAISRLEDADIAKEQLKLVTQQFLQQSSLTSLAQANQIPASYIQLIQQ